MTERRPPPRVDLPLLVVVTAAAAGITISVTAAGAHATTGASSGASVAAALGRGIIVALPLAVALYASRLPTHARFGRVLLIVSAVWFLGSLSGSSSPLLYSLGRVAGWVFDVALGYALLAFPHGRLRNKTDQTLVATGAAVLLTLYLPTALLVVQYPAPSAVSSCQLACPHNAFMITATQPALIGSVVAPVRELLTTLIFVAVAIRLATRIRNSNSLVRRVLSPVLMAMIARLIVYAAFLAARRAAPASALTDVTAWALSFAVPALALAFLIGLVRWHMFVTSGIRTVTAGLRQMPGPEQVRDMLAAAFDDPGLQIAHWSAQRRRWIDVAGAPLEIPAVGSDRHLTEVDEGGRRIVAIVHDAALRDDPTFLDAAAASATLAFESDRLSARSTRMIHELRASRARVLAAADDERRRVERDLHDGAQQRLLALYVHLELAAERREQEDPDEAVELRKLAGEVEEALEEMRSLTREIYPSMLADLGLEAAIRSVARRSPVRASVEADGLGEYPREILAAVYFCCVEALQNVAKHAHDAKFVEISLREAGSVLSFSVCDDGPGILDSNDRVGAGLVNMRDRMATVGGELAIRSRPARGTCVRGRIPVSALVRGGGARADAHESRRSRTTRSRYGADA